MAGSGGAGLSGPIGPPTGGSGGPGPPNKPGKPSKPAYTPFTAGPHPENKNKGSAGTGAPSLLPNATRPPAAGQGGTRGHWVPNGDNWSLIHATGPGQWTPGGVKGAKAPPKPTGPTPIPTNPLQPWTQQQVQRQATKTVGASYGPANASLNTQQSTAQNLYKQQTADDQAFSQWLSTSTQALSTKVDGINQKLLGVMQGAQQAQSAYLQGQPAQVAGSGETGAQSSGATPGVNQAALTSETAPAIGAANNSLSNALAQDAQQGITAQQGALGAGNVAIARQGVNQTNQLNGLNTMLNNIAGERTKLNAGQAGDVQKEIARLQGIQVSKAQYSASQGALEQKLGIAQQGANSLGAYRSAQAQTGAQNAITKALAQKETSLHNANMEKITSTHYATTAQLDAAKQAETARHNAATEAIGQQNANSGTQRAATGQQRANQAGQPKPPKPATPAQQRRITNQLTAVRNALLDDIQRYHQNAPNAVQLAYHDLQSGRYYKSTGKGVPKAPGGADQVSYLNAASNTLTNYGARGLTQGDLNFLAGQGLVGTGGYAVAGKTAQGPH